MAKIQKVITNREIREILTLKEELKVYESKAQITKESLQIKEKELFDALKKGAKTSELRWDVLPKVISRRFPKWKDFFINFAGEKAAQKILNKTKPTLYYTVSIKKKAKVYGGY